MMVVPDMVAGNWDPPIARAEEAVATWRRLASANGSAAEPPSSSWPASSEAEARAHLSQEAAQRAFQEGRTMSVDAALALAVGQDATAPRAGQDSG
jgi:hypothetical protein